MRITKVIILLIALNLLFFTNIGARGISGQNSPEYNQKIFSPFVILKEQRSQVDSSSTPEVDDNTFLPIRIGVNPVFFSTRDWRAFSPSSLELLYYVIHPRSPPAII